MTLVCKEGETISEAEFPKEAVPLIEDALAKHCSHNCTGGFCRARRVKDGPWVVRSAIDEIQQETSRQVSFLLKRD